MAFMIGRWAGAKRAAQVSGGNDGRTGRRSRPRRVFDTSVPSPCIAVCQIDPRTDLCIGCRRHLDEIRNWPVLTAEQKRAVLAQLPKRG